MSTKTLFLQWGSYKSAFQSNNYILYLSSVSIFFFVPTFFKHRKIISLKIPVLVTLEENLQHVFKVVSEFAWNQAKVQFSGFSFPLCIVATRNQIFASVVLNPTQLAMTPKTQYKCQIPVFSKKSVCQLDIIFLKKEKNQLLFQLLYGLFLIWERTKQFSESATNLY